MKTEIKFMKFQSVFGRNVAFAQLRNTDDEVLLDGPLSQIVEFADENGHQVTNAYEVLRSLLKLGYAS